MKRWLLLVMGAAACGSVTSLGACASDETASPSDPSPDADVEGMPDGDTGDTGAPDAGAEAAPCDDCELFPETCTDDALCPNGPFDSAGMAGLDVRTQINVIQGRSLTDVWVAGALGGVARFDGSSWRVIDTGAPDTFHALWLRDSAEVVFGTFERFFGRGVEVSNAAFDAGVPSSDGWTLQPVSSPIQASRSSLTLASAWTAPGSKWLWCAATAWRVGGTSGLWRVQLTETGFKVSAAIPVATCGSLPCSQLTSVHGSSANDIWAVGMTGTIIHVKSAESDTPEVKAFDGQTWNALHGVWAASESEAWSVGIDGAIRHYTGQPLAWDVVPDVPTAEDLNAVSGTSSSDVWAVGNAGVVLHYDGKAWSRVKIAGLGARRPNLMTVWTPAPGHVWVGGQGIVLSLGGKP